MFSQTSSDVLQPQGHCFATNHSSSPFVPLNHPLFIHSCLRISGTVPFAFTTMNKFMRKKLYLVHILRILEGGDSSGLEIQGGQPSRYLCYLFHDLDLKNKLVRINRPSPMQYRHVGRMVIIAGRWITKIQNRPANQCWTVLGITLNSSVVVQDITVELQPCLLFPACGWTCVRWKAPAGKGVDSLLSWLCLNFWVLLLLLLLLLYCWFYVQGFTRRGDSDARNRNDRLFVNRREQFSF